MGFPLQPGAHQVPDVRPNARIIQTGPRIETYISTTRLVTRVVLSISEYITCIGLIELSQKAGRAVLNLGNTIVCDN